MVGGAAQTVCPQSFAVQIPDVPVRKPSQHSDAQFLGTSHVDPGFILLFCGEHPGKSVWTSAVHEERSEQTRALPFFGSAQQPDAHSLEQKRGSLSLTVFSTTVRRLASHFLNFPFPVSPFQTASLALEFSGSVLCTQVFSVFLSQNPQ
jgi:hypothetical protein